MTKADYEEVIDEIYRLRELKQRALVENVEGERKKATNHRKAEFMNGWAKNMMRNWQGPYRESDVFL